MSQRKYYLRIFDMFFKNETAQRFEDSPHRYAMYVLYQKMLLRSARSGGRISFRGSYIDIEEQLAKDFDETKDIMKMVLSYFVKLGIAIKQEQYIFFPEASRLIGSECESAERVRRFRRKKEKHRNLTMESLLRDDAPTGMSRNTKLPLHSNNKVTDSSKKRYDVTKRPESLLQSNEALKKDRYEVTEPMLQSNGQETGRFKILIGDEDMRTAEKPRDYADVEDE